MTVEWILGVTRALANLLEETVIPKTTAYRKYLNSRNDFRRLKPT